MKNHGFFDSKCCLVQKKLKINKRKFWILSSGAIRDFRSSGTVPWTLVIINSEFYSSRITETYRRTSEAPTLRRSYYQTQTIPDPIQSQIPYLSTPEIFKNIQKTVPAGIHWPIKYTPYNKVETVNINSKYKMYCSILNVKWTAFSRWSFRPIFARGSIETTTMRKTHPTLRCRLGMISVSVSLLTRRNTRNTIWTGILS